MENLNNMTTNGAKDLTPLIKRGIGIAGTILMLISYFLPFAKASMLGLSASESLMGMIKSQDNGAAIWMYLIIALIVSLLGNNLVMILGGGLDAVAMLVSIMQGAQQSNGASVDVRIGFVLYIIASVVIMIGGIYGMIKKSQKK